MAARRTVYLFGIALLVTIVSMAIPHAQAPLDVALAATTVPVLGGSAINGGFVGIGTSMYFAGGYRPDGIFFSPLHPLRTASRYDSRTNTWTPIADLPATPSESAATTDGQLYVAAGGSLYRYDGSTNSWILRTQAPGMIVGSPNGRLYGFTGSPPIQVQAYDPAANVWQTISSVPDGRAVARPSVASNGRLYLFGGDPTDSVQTVLEFDPATGAWAKVGTTPVLGQYARATASSDGNSIYVVGISRTAGCWEVRHMTYRAARFNPATREWTMLPPQPTPVDGPGFAAATTTDGDLWTAGGFIWSFSCRFSGGLGSFDHFDVETNSWYSSTPSPALLSVVIADNRPAVNSSDVMLTMTPDPSVGTPFEMRISNDGGPWSPWLGFQTRAGWSVAPGEGTRRVIVQVRDRVGRESEPVWDVIEVDMYPPYGSLAFANSTGAARRAASPVLPLVVTVSDTRATAAQIEMRLSNRPDFAGAVWQPYAASVNWDFAGGGTVYGQFRDHAGNLSGVVSLSIPGAPLPPTSPSASCSPRPRVVVTTQASGGALNVTLSTTGANNGLRAVRFDSFTNAIVDVGDQQNQSAPFAVSLPPGSEPTSLLFTVRRPAGGESQPTTVRLVVIDGCGEWSTFVGGGPSAF